MAAAAGLTVRTPHRLRWTLGGAANPVTEAPHLEGRLRTFRNASFCSRCLLIIGVTWSVSELGPSLSAPPHQSSSLLYSCSRLSRTLQTCGRRESRLRGTTGHPWDDECRPEGRDRHLACGHAGFQNKAKIQGEFPSSLCPVSGHPFK